MDRFTMKARGCDMEPFLMVPAEPTPSLCFLVNMLRLSRIFKSEQSGLQVWFRTFIRSHRP